MKGVGVLAVTVLSSLSQALCAPAGDAVDRLKACAQFEGMERLKCVDELLGEMAGKPDSTQPQGTNWIISETTSPVDYRPQIAALTTARASSQDAPSSLAIHCRNQRTELTISTTGSWKPATEGEVKVVYRINEQPSVEQRWSPAETGRGLAFPGDVVRFLRSVPDGGQFLVRVYAGKSPPYETTFKLAGLDPVRRKIAAACNWPGGGAVVAATTAVVERVTAATPVPERKANNKDRSNHAETVLRGDAEKTASASPNNTDHLVALLMARPEIKSVSDLADKNVAIDGRQTASNNNVRTAIVAAGAAEVQLSDSQTRAVDRLARLDPAGDAAAKSDTPPAKIANSAPEAAAAIPSGRTIREQVAAATALAERVTVSTAVSAPEPSDADVSSPNEIDNLVALVMARAEIKSVSDLTSKTIAIDDKHSASVRNVRTAIVAAGASEVELIGIRTKAINVLISGAVPAAVLALVSSEAAEWFPDIAGFKIFRVPLSPRSLKARP
jgi:ABC-type phosphate/phosphonate transport system substrate-binding protein